MYNMKDLLILATVILLGIIYYRYSASKNPFMRKIALAMKITMLCLSLILAFINQDYLVIGGIAFGGRISVMILILIEIVDTIVDKK
jgi:hypothetical protein